MANVVVIGAGISGLTAAYALSNAGHEVAVLDQGRRAGGCMQSDRLAGFLMERGPNGMGFPAPRAENLVADLGLAPEAVHRGAGARHRYLVRDGRIHRLPLQPHRFFFSDFLSPAGRLRLLMEPFVSPNRADETVADFARRRFGREFFDYLIDPLVAGLHAGDPEQLSVAAVFPHLKRLERAYGSIVLAAIRSRIGSGAGDAACHSAKRELISFRGGLGVLPQALARRLAGRLFLHQRVESVRRAPRGGFIVTVSERGATQSRKADGVVIALPAYAAARVIARLDPDVAQALAQIRHSPLAVAFLGYRAQAIAHPLDGTGVLMPGVEQRNVLGMIFSSALFAGRAPPGHVALTAFVGGARRPRLALLRPRELQELAHDEARLLLGARAAPLVARTHCWRHGLPQPGLDHARRIAQVAALEQGHPGMFFTGNYFSGVSTVACIQQAFDAAARAEHLFASPNHRSKRRAHPFQGLELPVDSGSELASRVAAAGCATA